MRVVIKLIAIFLFTCQLASAQEKTTYRGDTSLYSRIRDSILQVTEMINKSPGNGRLYFKRARLFFDSEQWKKAESDLTRAIAADTGNFNLYYKRGATRERLLELGDAYEDFSKTLSLNPSYEPAYLDRGIILGNSKVFKDADNDFRAALKIKPNWSPALFCIGLNFEDQGKPDSAAWYYKLAIRYDSSSYKAYNNLGSLYKGQKQYTLAIQQYDKAIKIWKGYALAFMNRAEVKFYSGDKAGACDDLQQAIKLGRKDKIQVYNQYCN